MNRFEQRLQKRLQNEEFAAGYREMAAELELMHAIEMLCKHRHMMQEKFAVHIEQKQEAVPHLLSVDDVNPMMHTFIELLHALNLTADITIRQAREGEGLIKITMEFTTPQ